MNRNQKLGEILVRQRALKRAQLDDALRMQKRSGGRIGDVVVQMGFVSEDAIAAALAAQFCYPLHRLATVKSERKALLMLTPEFAYARLVLPLKITDSEFHCVIADPLDFVGADLLRKKVGRRVVLMIGSHSKLLRAIGVAYGIKKPIRGDTDRVVLTRKPKPEPQDDRAALLDSLLEGSKPKGKAA